MTATLHYLLLEQNMIEAYICAPYDDIRIQASALYAVFCGLWALVHRAAFLQSHVSTSVPFRSILNRNP